MTGQSVILMGAMISKPATKEQAAPKKGAVEPAERRRPTQDERRAAILAAALDVFAENGFAAARLDDVAQKAGVAKGTLYLYFPGQRGAVRSASPGSRRPRSPAVRGAVGRSRIACERDTRRYPAVFQTEIIGTNRERLLRLIIAEGPRFPKIAEFYHREIISKGREIIRAIVTRGYERGELASDAMARFPQLFFAPLLTAVLWRSMFSQFDPLDVNAMIECHRKLMLGLKDEETPK